MDLESHHPAAKSVLTCHLEATGTNRLLTCPLEATGTNKPPSSLKRVTGAATREPPNTHAHATEFMSARRQVEVVGWQIYLEKLRSALGDHAEE